MSLLDAVNQRNLNAVNAALLSEIPSQECNKALQLACTYGDVPIVSRLLEDSRVDPTALDEQSIQFAVDPHATTNYSLLLAITYRHFDVVNLLLAKSTVNPGAGNNRAIELASQIGDVRIVERLLQDSRVDPRANRYHALKLALDASNRSIVRLFDDYFLNKNPDYKTTLPAKTRSSLDYLINTQRFFSQQQTKISETQQTSLCTDISSQNWMQS